MKRRGTPCVDPSGRSWPSYAAMAEAHGVARHTFEQRRSAGWDLSRALEPGDHRSPGGVVDHTGRVHVSIRAMCRFWRRPHPTVVKRMARGMSVEAAITALATRPIPPGPRGLEWARRVMDRWLARQEAA